MNKKSRLIEILLVEDNPGDADLVVEVLEDSRVRNELSIVEDGEEAMDFLYKNGKFSDSQRPDLILLDLNLPKMDGREVLEKIKSDSEFRRIPIVVLTTSKAEEDILRSYDLHANAYIAKPVDINQFINVIRIFEDFWLDIVKLPVKKAQ